MMHQMNKVTIMPLFTFSSIFSHGILFYPPHVFFPMGRPHTHRTSGCKIRRRPHARRCTSWRPRACSCSQCPQPWPCPSLPAVVPVPGGLRRQVWQQRHLCVPRQPHACLGGRAPSSPRRSFPESERGICSLLGLLGSTLCQMKLG